MSQLSQKKEEEFNEGALEELRLPLPVPPDPPDPKRVVEKESDRGVVVINITGEDE